MTELFLAWQDPIGRSWFPIGCLGYDEERYRFAYTRGAETARNLSGFQPLRFFPDFRTVYESDELFPFFSNRLPNRGRSDYAEYVSALDLRQDESDPIALMALSGGRRATDSYELFPSPERTPDGRYRVRFFAHGLRYFPPESAKRVLKLRPDDRLLLVHDFQNPHDSRALALRTNDAFEGDRSLVGFCPRYLVHDFFDVLTKPVDPPPMVTVQRVNPPPSPLQLRLLCTLVAGWPAGFQPFSAPDYLPLVSSEVDTPDV